MTVCGYKGQIRRFRSIAAPTLISHQWAQFGPEHRQGLPSARLLFFALFLWNKDFSMQEGIDLLRRWAGMVAARRCSRWRRARRSSRPRRPPRRLSCDVLERLHMIHADRTPKITSSSWRSRKGLGVMYNASLLKSTRGCFGKQSQVLRTQGSRAQAISRQAGGRRRAGAARVFDGRFGGRLSAPGSADSSDVLQSRRGDSDRAL